MTRATTVDMGSVLLEEAIWEEIATKMALLDNGAKGGGVGGGGGPGIEFLSERLCTMVENHEPPPKEADADVEIEI